MGPVTDTHRITYRENVQLALQEMRRQFDDKMMFDPNLRGQQVQITDLVGSSEARLDAPEGGDTPDIENNHEPIWVQPRRIDWGKLLREEDAIKSLTDFRSPYTQSGANAIIRQRNRLLAGGIFAPRLIGNQVPVSTAWAGSTVPITWGSADGATNVGMNVKKILHGMKLMEDADIDTEMEDLYLVLDPQEIEDLYNDITYVNRDYRSKAVLEEKRVLEILGIPIIPSKRIADAAANQSTAGLYCKSGMVWGDFSPVKITSAPNPAKQFREHIYIETWLGVTRTEDAKAVKIINKY